MFSVKSFIAFVVGFLAGYLLSGPGFGVVLGGILATLQFFLMRRVKRVDVSFLGAMPQPTAAQERARLQRIEQRYEELKPPPLQFRLLCVWFGILALPMFYDVVLALTSSSSATHAWVQSFQPAVDWLGAYVPAIERIPSDLDVIGQVGWAPLVQHAMFVSWVVTALILIWIVLDIWFFHPGMWTDPAISRPKELVGGTAACGVISAIAFAMFFFGQQPSSWRDSFVGSGLPKIGVLFFFSMFFVFMFIIGIAALVRSITYRNSVRRDTEKERRSRNEMSAALRNAFRKPRKI